MSTRNQQDGVTVVCAGVEKRFALTEGKLSIFIVQLAFGVRDTDGYSLVHDEVVQTWDRETWRTYATYTPNTRLEFKSTRDRFAQLKKLLLQPLIASFKPPSTQRPHLKTA